MRKSILSAASAAAITLALATSASAADSPLTWDGITLYGNVDVGISYQTHGAPTSDTFYPGEQWLISSNSNKAQFNLGPGGLSQSFIGLKGFEEFAPGFAAIFDVQAAFNPWSGTLANAGQTLRQNAGVPAAQQSANGDGSRNGEAFQRAVFGVQSKEFGTVTIGRQTGTLGDAISGYDPMGGYAFSPIDYSGVARGAGDTEDNILDSSAKWFINSVGTLPIHLGVTLQNNGTGPKTGPSEEFKAGADYMGFSVDGVYSHIKDAVSAGALSAAQTLTLPAGTLTAKISDNTSYTGLVKYTTGPATVEGGLTHIYYANPSNPEPVGFTGLGGYIFSTVNNAGYNNNKVLTISWVGGKYKATDHLTLSVMYTHYSQNSFNKDNGCSNNSNSACSGQLNAYSALAEYNFNKRFELYGGAMYSSVANGLAAGFINTSTIDPIVGMRFSF